MLRTILTLFTLVGALAVQPIAAQNTQSPAAARPAKPVGIVNLNTATPAELATLPGIGAKVALRIIEYREKKGPFKKIEELMNVQGIGEKSFLKLRAQLTVGGKSETTGQQ